MNKIGRKKICGFSQHRRGRLPKASDKINCQIQFETKQSLNVSFTGSESFIQANRTNNPTQ